MLTTINDYRYIENKNLIKKIESVAFKQLEKINNPHFIILIRKYSPVINLSDFHYVNIYTAITPSDISNLVCGNIVTRVYFPNINAIEDLIDALMSNNDQKFIIMETTSFFFYEENERRLHIYQFVFDTIIKKVIGAKIKIKENDRFFYITNSKFNKEGIYLAYQRQKNLKNAEIFSIKECKAKSHGIIHLDAADQCKDEKRHIFHRIKKRKEKNYEKLD